MKKFFKENRKGFTLIELLVVIAILAVLATLYVPRIINSANTAKETVEIANARTLASEITQYNTRESVAGHAIFKGSGAIPTDWDAEIKAKYTGYTLLKDTDITSSSIPEIKVLLDGRSFPTGAVILIDGTNGSCIVLQTDGTVYTD